MDTRSTGRSGGKFCIQANWAGSCSEAISEGVADRSATPSLIASEQLPAQFAWMQNFPPLRPVERVSIDQFRFDAHAAVQTQQRNLDNQQNAAGGTEWVTLRLT